MPKRRLTGRTGPLPLQTRSPGSRSPPENDVGILLYRFLPLTLMCLGSTKETESPLMLESTAGSGAGRANDSATSLGGAD